MTEDFLQIGKKSMTNQGGFGFCLKLILQTTMQAGRG